MTEYSRYILMKGTYTQQAKLVEGIRAKFVIRDKRIQLQ